MSEFYKWDPSQLSVNVNEMDDEHQELIRRMNRLYSIYFANPASPEVKGAVEDLVNYTVKHFQDEEAYMVKVGFPGYETHKVIHQQLLNQVTTHVQDFQNTGKLSESFFDFLSIWLTSHIRGIDIKYGQDFKNYKIGA